ncbi:MAG: BolA/IbaG family iron-sulfur metabolism protein [Pseudomonadota bacterium]|nr:BolA/IbaG family iron-sulfur metabolism protein [Pseudomonadota bacterium]MEC8996421.1 BolA/IbaG family iron-sulfur metabolism protein [Pseudomonadota bacterium]MED5430147.1 BolA/IbaG family iron-sulfur metabolism protein [Pseudomonadota bacterium]
MQTTIKDILSSSFKDADIEVSGSESKFDVKIISDDFQNKSTIDRHKMVYALLNKYIISGEIHALTIKSHTKEENEGL